MVEIYHEDQVSLDVLKDKTIGIIGYGNQGRAQALNLRDSGLKVIIGNIEDKYKAMARNDGFEVYSIEIAVSKSDILFILVPDEIMKNLLEKEIIPHLKPSSTLNFASGYNVGFKLLTLPSNVDIIMIAPRMIGVGVRETYLNGKGFFSFISVEQDVSGNARDTLLGLAKALGALKKGAIMLSMKDEAVLDLFNEQAFGPAFGRVLLTSIKVLLDAGYPAEAVLVEMYMSGEMSYTYKKMAEIGLVKQTDFHSHTSQYGAMSRGIRYLNLPIKPIMEKILKDIQTGVFTKEWEKKITKLKFKFIKFFATHQKINEIEKQVRKRLKMKLFDIYTEEPPTAEDIKESAVIADELKPFEEYYES
ncbi:MAG: ketol-acid reductoisomerase [Candidatus Thorarchaeota archaeon]